VHLDKNEHDLVTRSNSIPHTLIFYSLGVLCIVAGLVIVFGGYGYDDPYITFRYAWNLTHGNGFVFNVGEPVLSTTTPGYTLILAAIGLFYENIPLLGTILSALGLGIGAVSLYAWARLVKQPVSGWVSGLLLLTFPLLIATFGSEMCLYLGLLLGGFYLHVCGNSSWAIAIIALATMVRPDSILAAGLMMTHDVFRPRLVHCQMGQSTKPFWGRVSFLAKRYIPWQSLTIYLALLLPWIVYGWGFFGSPVPVTLSAKQAQGQMEISQSFAWGAWKMAGEYAQDPLYWLFLPLVVIGTWQIVAKNRTWLILIVWTTCYFTAYTLLGVSRYFWYYAPLVPGVVLTVAVGVDWIQTKIASWQWHRLWSWAAILLLLACMVWANVKGLHYIQLNPDPRLRIYRQAGEWIDANLGKHASIGTLEVGVIGYYARRRIVDFAGLLQPKVASEIEPTTTYQDTARWAIERYSPAFLLLDQRWFPEMQDQINAFCSPLHTWTGQRYRSELTIHKCDWGR
jgi:hypothetical protein